MPNHPFRLIRNGALEKDTWRLMASDITTQPPDEDGWMVKLETWKNNYEQLRLRKHPVAILMPSDADATDIVYKHSNNLNSEAIAFIAIDFPIYTDGRGFSLAQILRNQLGWKRELRAIGDVLIDTIHYLSRCGFDSFLVKEGHDPQLALQAFETFTVHYQRSYSQPIK